MIKLKLCLSAAMLFVLSGCTSTYYLEGKEYKDETSFQQATDQLHRESLAQITPLPMPLTSKGLVYAFPSEEAIYNENIRRHISTTGAPPTGIAVDQYRNLGKHASKSLKAIAEAIRKRGVFTEVRLIETETMVNSIEPSDSYDVMYYTEASVGSGQTFYASTKHGKQVFAYDRSGSTPTAKTNAIIDAVQTFAIRE